LTIVAALTIATSSSVLVSAQRGSGSSLENYSNRNRLRQRGLRDYQDKNDETYNNEDVARLESAFQEETGFWGRLLNERGGRGGSFPTKKPSGMGTMGTCARSSFIIRSFVVWPLSMHCSLHGSVKQGEKTMCSGDDALRIILFS